MMLIEERPACIAWGDQFVTLYNDALASLIETRRPEALAKPLSYLLGKPLTELRAELEALDGGAPEWSLLGMPGVWLPLRSATGEIGGLLGRVPGDATAAAVHPADVASGPSASLDVFKACADTMNAFVAITDGAGLNVFTNRFFQSFTGLAAERALAEGWLDAVHPHDLCRARGVWASAVARRSVYAAEYRFRRHDGAYRWFMCCGIPNFDRAGGVDRWVIVCFDVHDSRKAQAELEGLVGELQHRTRNLLNVINSLALKLALRARSVRDFQVQLEDRLMALSRLQSLLSQGATPITVRQLLLLELVALQPPGAESRTVIEGPHVILPKRMMQDLALAIHELATNAVKHGCFTSETGTLAVTWRLAVAHGARRLTILWREAGLEQRREGPVKRGVGRDLIERVIPFKTNGATSFWLGATELECQIEIPLEDGP